jgi:hypothetical protein
VCGKRLKVMIPTLLPALERHGRLQLAELDRDGVLAVSRLDAGRAGGGLMNDDQIIA